MDFADLKPYTSLLIARIKDSAQQAAIVAESLADIATELRLKDPGDPDPSRRIRGESLSVASQEDTIDTTDGPLTEVLEVGGFHYQEIRPPRWLDNTQIALEDTLNHLVLVSRRGLLVTVFLSEPAAKPIVARALDKASLAGLSGLAPIAPGLLNAAFVDGPARTLWLSGIHRRTATKADSKILAGLSLEDALDPLGDQSYFFTAVRSVTELPQQAGRMPVGVSPRRSRVWAGPTSRWPEFRRNVRVLLGKLQTTDDADKEVDNPLPVLAVPTSDAGGVNNAYDVSIVAPELLADDPSLDPNLQQKAERWGYRSGFRVVESNGLAFKAEVSVDGTSLAELSFIPESEAGRTTFAVELVPDSGDPDREDLVAEAIEVAAKPRWLKVRYESGHTLTDGVFYSMRYRDVRFERWVFADLTGFNVKKEKPGVGSAFAVDDIGVQGEASLFSWTQRTWPFPLEPADAKQRGWLASDDGAGEIADFIHYDFDRPDPANPAKTLPLLTLIHVKASGSDTAGRGISTSDYEVVVGQAVKNLRSLDRTNLADRLEEGMGKTVGSAIWLNGQKIQTANGQHRADFIARLRQDGENFDRRVVVLQPRVRQAAYEEARKDQDADQQTAIVARLQQLDTLLVGAQADCRNLGAELIVVGAQKP